MNASERIAGVTGKGILKKLDLRAGITAIAAAIGFSVQGIAEGFGRFVTGMTSELEETLKRIDTITARASDQTIASMRKQASEETQYQLLLLERERILKRLATNRSAEPAPELSFMAKLRSVPTFGGLPNPLYDGGNTAAAEGGAASLENKEKEKSRLTDVGDAINDIEKKRTEEAAKQTAELKKQKTVKAEIVHQSKEHLKTEIALTEQMRAQQAAIEAADEAQGRVNLLLNDTIILMGKAYGTSRDPASLENASDETLKELIARNRKEIAQIELDKGRGATALADAATNFLPQGAVIGRLTTDIIRSQFQLDQRAALRRDAAQGGIGGARSRFSGDPLKFDELFAKFVSNQDATSRIASGLDKLNQQLSKGVPTVLFGSE